MCCSVSCDFFVEYCCFWVEQWWDRKQYPMHDRTHQKRHDKLLGVRCGKCGKMARWDISIALPCALGKAGGELFWKKPPTANPVKKKNCFRCSGFFFHWLGKDPNQSIKKWLVARDCSEGVRSKRKATHNATLPETNVATETLGSENKFPFGKASRQCYVSFSECTVRRGSWEIFSPWLRLLLPSNRPLSTKTIHSRWLNYPFEKQYSFNNFYG